MTPQPVSARDSKKKWLGRCPGPQHLGLRQCSGDGQASRLARTWFAQLLAQPQAFLELSALPYKALAVASCVLFRHKLIVSHDTAKNEERAWLNVKLL